MLPGIDEAQSAATYSDADQLVLQRAVEILGIPTSQLSGRLRQRPISHISSPPTTIQSTVPISTSSTSNGALDEPRVHGTRCARDIQQDARIPFSQHSSSTHHAIYGFSPSVDSCEEPGVAAHEQRSFPNDDTSLPLLAFQDTGINTLLYTIPDDFWILPHQLQPMQQVSHSTIDDSSNLAPRLAGEDFLTQNTSFHSSQVFEPSLDNLFDVPESWFSTQNLVEFDAPENGAAWEPSSLIAVLPFATQLGIGSILSRSTTIDSFFDIFVNNHSTLDSSENFAGLNTQQQHFTSSADLIRDAHSGLPEQITEHTNVAIQQHREELSFSRAVDTCVRQSSVGSPC